MLMKLEKDRIVAKVDSLDANLSQLIDTGDSPTKKDNDIS